MSEKQRKKFRLISQVKLIEDIMVPALNAQQVWRLHESRLEYVV